MSDKTPLGDRMKDYEKRETARRPLPMLPVCVRLDGKRFSRWTKGLERPYDPRLSALMVDTTRHLLDETSAVIGYTQSDEISLVLWSDDPKRQLFLDGRLQKLVSILASIPILDGFVFRDETGAVSPGVISQLEGAVLVAGLGVYVWFSARTGRVTAEDIEAEVELELGAPVDRPVGTARSVFAHLLLTLVGLGGLILGAELLVDGGKSMASAVGMSSAVIGLTVVAIGTSIPELAFSVRAAQRGQSELALANVLGSNAFNLLSVLGIAAIVDPIVVPEEAAQRDVWVMLAISTLVWPIVLVRRKLGRPEGLTLLAIYAVYLAFVVWPATAG